MAHPCHMSHGWFSHDFLTGDDHQSIDDMPILLDSQDRCNDQKPILQCFDHGTALLGGYTPIFLAVFKTIVLVVDCGGCSIHCG